MPVPPDADRPGKNDSNDNAPANLTRPAQSVPWGRFFLLLVWTALVAGIYGVYSGAVPVDARYNPWAPLDVSAEPAFLTSYKMSRALNQPALCMAVLAGSGMRYDVLPDRTTGSGCGFENAVLLRTAGVRFGAPLPLSCPMALSFAMWERHVLQPAAMSRFQQRIVAIDQLGSYACRNINTGEGGVSGQSASRSRHATADALDVSGFTLADGKRISVLKNWQGKGEVNDAATPRESKALLLEDLHAGACKYFKGVLGPDYNAVHADHFHLETGGYSMCR